MKKQERTACYDKQLGIEVYHLDGVTQPFPVHFHDYYVIGFVEEGERRLSCSSGHYNIGRGSILLFPPGESHSCEQNGESLFRYRGMNIGKDVMAEFVREAAKWGQIPEFSQTVIEDDELLWCLKHTHMQLMNQCSAFEKEENLLIMLSLLMERYGSICAEQSVSSGREEIEKACRFLKEHYAERISLEQICEKACLGKTALIRAFTKDKGMTPYRYLENIRINEAKKLLEQGIPAAETALRTGFSDQSHFTNFFRMFIGLTPGAYRDMFVKGKEIRCVEQKGGEQQYGA